MRRIDADELITQMGWKLGLGDEENGANVDYMEALEDCKELIDNAPTIEERPQGKYIDGTQGHYCSLCYEIDYAYYDHKFCPFCGAEMEIENE